MEWPGGLNDGNIPDNSYIVIMPSLLLAQFTAECCHYIPPSPVIQSTVLLYCILVRSTCMWTGGNRYMKWANTKHCIALWLHQPQYVICFMICYFHADLIYLHCAGTCFRHGLCLWILDPFKLGLADKVLDVWGGWWVGVVFGKQWTLSVVDEVHNFQKPNKMFWVVKSIHSTPNSFIAMMATLVQMCPAVCAQTLISAIILLTN